jgi:hypothetical protein
MLIESSPTRWNAAKAGQFILHKIPVHLWHNLSRIEWSWKLPLRLRSWCLKGCDVNWKCLSHLCQRPGPWKDKCPRWCHATIKGRNLPDICSKPGHNWGGGGGGLRPPRATESTGRRNGFQIKKHFLSLINFKIIEPIKGNSMKDCDTLDVHYVC